MYTIVHNSRKTSYTLIRLAKARLQVPRTLTLYTILVKTSYSLYTSLMKAGLYVSHIVTLHTILGRKKNNYALTKLTTAPGLLFSRIVIICNVRSNFK